MTWVAGVDACKGGWFVVATDVRSGRTIHAVKKTFSEVLAMGESPRIVAVDIPIGLPEKARRGVPVIVKLAGSSATGIRASSRRRCALRSTRRRGRRPTR